MHTYDHPLHQRLPEYHIESGISARETDDRKLEKVRMKGCTLSADRHRHRRHHLAVVPLKTRGEPPQGHHLKGGREKRGGKREEGEEEDRFQ